MNSNVPTLGQELDNANLSITANESTITNEERIRMETSINDMSEQLMEAMNQNQELESKLIKLQEQLDFYDSVKEEEIKKLKESMSAEIKLRETSDLEASKLREEISELSASLFEEANKMVALEKENSYKKEQEIKKLNIKLKEKHDLENDLIEQLSSLKEILQDITVNSKKEEDESAKSILSKSRDLYDISDDNKILFSPFMKNIRFDTTFYQEFLKFLAVLPFSKDIYDTRTDSKLIKRIISYDIEPALKLDSSKSLAWSHKKNLVSWLVSGDVLVEPISGLNETFKNNHSESGRKLTPLDSKLFKFPIDSPPVAVPDPCSICNENRNDTLEHNRMYYMKLPSQSSKRDYHSYPLCHYCVLKVRSIGDIFSLLRGVKMGVWKLEKVALSKQVETSNGVKKTATLDAKSDINEVAGKRKRSLSRAAKRSSMISDAFNMFNVSSSSSYEPTATVLSSNEQQVLPVPADGNFTNVQLCFLELCRLRNRLYWADLGIWSLDNADDDHYCITNVIKPNEEPKVNRSMVEEQTLKLLLGENSSSELVREDSGEKATAEGESKSDDINLTEEQSEKIKLTQVQEEISESPEQDSVSGLNSSSKIIEEEELNEDSGFDFEEKKSLESLEDVNIESAHDSGNNNIDSEQKEVKNGADEAKNVSDKAKISGDEAKINQALTGNEEEDEHDRIVREDADEAEAADENEHEPRPTVSAAETNASSDSNGMFFDSYQQQ